MVLGIFMNAASREYTGKTDLSPQGYTVGPQMSLRDHNISLHFYTYKGLIKSNAYVLLSEKIGIARIRSYCHLLDILTSVKPYFLGNKFKFLTIFNHREP